MNGILKCAALLEVFTRVRMDLYQGSLPRKFIRFRLDPSSPNEQTPGPLTEKKSGDPQISTVQDTSQSAITTNQPSQVHEEDTGADSDETSEEDVTEYATRTSARLESLSSSPKQSSVQVGNEGSSTAPIVDPVSMSGREKEPGTG